MFVRVVDTPSTPRAKGGPAREERSFEIQPRGGRLYRLRLWGDLSRDWAAALFGGLARHRIGVVRGEARRRPDGRSVASFLVEREARGSDPLLLDVLGLIGRGRGPTAAPFVIEHHRLYPSAAYGGSLRLELMGPDQHGFLAGLFERLAFLSLVPEAMRVQTGPGGVFDRFDLKTSDGRTPGPAVQRVLSEVLDGRLLTGHQAVRAG